MELLIKGGKMKTTSNGLKRKIKRGAMGSSKRVLTIGAAALVSVALLAGPAAAFRADLSDEVKVDLDLSLTYSAAWRAKSPDKAQLNKGAGFSAYPNGDDGNRAFKKGDMVNNRVSALLDMDIQWKNYGIFGRGNAFYDAVYMGKSSWDADPSTNNNHVSNGGPLKNANEFTDETKDRHGQNVELMDLYVYGSGDVADSPYSFRVGRHSVSWGESLFIANGISGAQSPMDLSKANVAGAELKDIFLPIGQVSGQITVGDNFTFAGYYGWEWEPTRLDESGSYFSAVDAIDEAGGVFMAETPVGMISLDRVEDEDPSEDGQWGVALRYLAEGLNDTEFGLYYINYHETIPMLVINDFDPTNPNSPLSGTPSPGGPWGIPQLDFVDMSSYNLVYPENIRLTGASFSTVVGDHNVSGEVSYRKDLPVAVNVSKDIEAIKGLGWEEADVLQAQVSTFSLWGDNGISDGITIATEVGFVNVLDVSDETLWFDKFAWGGAAKVKFDYFGVLVNGLDMSIPFTYKFNPEGVSSVMLGLLFHEDADTFATGLDFTYDHVWTFGVGYTDFIGGAKDNNKNDRDFYSFNLKRAF
jgi:hypothetical protein